MNKYVIYSDGSLKGTSVKRGGYSAIICDENENIIKELYGGFLNTTSNRMEIKGVIEGLTYIKESSEITIISDSQYVVNTINEGWLNMIITHPDRFANIDLWTEIARLLQYHIVKFVWTKGHADNEMNNRADKLAQFAAKCLNLPEDEYINNGEENRKSLVPESETRWSDGFNTRQENGEIVYSFG